MKGEGKTTDHSRVMRFKSLQACQGCLREGAYAPSTFNLRPSSQARRWVLGDHSTDMVSSCSDLVGAEVVQSSGHDSCGRMPCQQRRHMRHEPAAEGGAAGLQQPLHILQPHRLRSTRQAAGCNGTSCIALPQSSAVSALSAEASADCGLHAAACQQGLGAILSSPAVCCRGQVAALWSRCPPPACCVSPVSPAQTPPSALHNHSRLEHGSDCHCSHARHL